jgi:tight adherence protein B
MLYTILAIGFLFLAATGTAGWIIHIFRKRHFEKERRLGLLSGNSQKATVAPEQVAAAAAGGSSCRGAVQKFFTFGAGYSWGMTASAPLLVIAAAVCAGAVWFVSIRGLGFSPLTAGALSAAAAVFGPRTILKRQHQAAMRKFGDNFPDAVDMIARMLRAGTPITYAIQVVGDEAPAPVNEVFTTLSDQIRIGIPVGDALDMSSKTVASPDFRFFAVAAIMQYSTGGNLVATLEELAQIMRKRQAARLKARAVSSEIRFSAYVLGSLPIFVTCALLVMDPGYLAPLFRDPRGHFVLSLAAGGLLLAFVTMRQMIRSVSDE